MARLDIEDEALITQIDTKPYRLYLLTDFLQMTQNPKQLESRLNRLNDARIIFKVSVKNKTYYFSPKAETAENN
jgi:hypothetical protein